MLAFLLGLGLGLSLAAPPGPMNALIAREASARGWLQGIRLGMGAPVADVLWLVVLLFGLGRLLDGPGVLRVAGGLGALLMFFFAYDTWTVQAKAPKARPTFLAGFGAALINPFQAAWWLSGGFLFLKTQGVIGVAGLITGIFGWVVAFSWLVAHGAQRWHWFAPAIRWISTHMLLFFAMVLALIGIGGIKP